MKPATRQVAGKDLAASVRARLLNMAKAEQSDFNGVLVRYALERLLYRLSQSAHANSFLLKGAMLFTLWYDSRTGPRVMLICWVLGRVTRFPSRKPSRRLPQGGLKTASALTLKV